MVKGSRMWKNVTTQIEIELTDEMRDELGLFEDAKSLNLEVKHYGHFEPAVLAVDPDDSSPEEDELEISSIEGVIEFEDSADEVLSKDQIFILGDERIFDDLIVSKIMEG